MRVFVYEHMNSGALAGASGAASLHAEGWAMLTAVLADFGRCSGVETVTLLDAHLAAPGQVVHAVGPAEEERAFRALARAADCTLVIAPECGSILEQRCALVEAENGKLLGPSSLAVRLTADKLALASHLISQGIATPPSRPFVPGMPCPFQFPVVVKPRDGAGSMATRLIASIEDWEKDCAAIAAEYPGDRILQPFVPGQAASVAFLIGPRQSVALLPAEQNLSVDGRFHYLGGRCPLSPDEARRATALAEKAVAAVPGLKGFVGVDLVLAENPDESGDTIIEINPRLTTSYVGLRELAEFNLAESMLAVAMGETPPLLRWNSGSVTWLPDGTIKRNQ